MADLFDTQSIDIPCPACGRKHNKTVGWLKANSEIPCPCGTNLCLDTEGFLRPLKQLEDALADIPREITIKF